MVLHPMKILYNLLGVLAQNSPKNTPFSIQNKENKLFHQLSGISIWII